MGAAGADGEERLNAELKEGDTTEGDLGLDAAAGVVAGIEKSRRSFIPEGAGLDAVVGAGEENAEKSPNPPEVCFGAWGGVAFGVASKNPPPPPKGFDEDVEGGDLVLEKLSRPANGEGLATGWELKLRPPNASLRPPTCDCWSCCCVCTAPNPPRPPKDS